MERDITMPNPSHHTEVYRAHLAKVYSPELQYLADELFALGHIVDTGGGIMAVEADIGTVPNSTHRLVLTATNSDPGLSEDRNAGIHWQVGLYDGDEGGDPLSEGHDTRAFDAAVRLAISNLHKGVQPTFLSCDCGQ